MTDGERDIYDEMQRDAYDSFMSNPPSEVEELVWAARRVIRSCDCVHRDAIEALEEALDQWKGVRNESP